MPSNDESMCDCSEYTSTTGAHGGASPNVESADGGEDGPVTALGVAVIANHVYFAPSNGQILGGPL
jgi:hypothetical protein